MPSFNRYICAFSLCATAWLPFTISCRYLITVTLRCETPIVTGHALVWTAHKVACLRLHVHVARKRDARQKYPKALSEVKVELLLNIVKYYLYVIVRLNLTILNDHLRWGYLDHHPLRASSSDYGWADWCTVYNNQEVEPPRILPKEATFQTTSTFSSDVDWTLSKIYNI